MSDLMKSAEAAFDKEMESLAKPNEVRIIGYRDLTKEEIALMNQIKEVANETGRLVEGMAVNGKIDTRWVAIARTQLQQGFMALTRAVAQPTSF